MAELPDRIRQARGQYQIPLCRTEIVGDTSRPSRGQRDRRQRAGKPFAPVAELGRAIWTRTPLPLPGGKVGKLYWRRRKWRRFSGGEGFVESGQLFGQQTHRTAVNEALMHTQEEKRFLLGQAQQACAHKRTALEIERM